MGKPILKRNFKRKAKPILNAKRFKNSISDEKPNCSNNSLETKSVLRDVDSQPRSITAPLIEGSQDLVAVEGNQCMSNDSFNVATNSSLDSNTLNSIDNSKNISYSNSTTRFTNSCVTSTSGTELSVFESISPIVKTTKATVNSVSSCSKRMLVSVPVEQSSVGFNDKTKFFKTETDNILDEKYNVEIAEEKEESTIGLGDDTKLFRSEEVTCNSSLASLDKKNSEIVKGSSDIIPLGGIRDKKIFLKNTLQNQKLTNLLSKLNCSAPLFKITVLEVTDEGPKVVTLPYCKSDDTSLLSTSDYNKSLDHSVKVVTEHEDSEVKENSLVTTKKSGITPKKYFSSKKIPDLENLRFHSVKVVNRQEDSDVKENSSTTTRKSGVSPKKYFSFKKIPDLENLRSKSCGKSDVRSVRFPSSMNNETLDSKANVSMSMLGDSDMREDNLRMSDISNKKSLSYRKKPDMAKLRLKAYDEHGNLNKKQLTLRDFIYFNPPHHPIRKNDAETSPKSCDIDLDSDSDSSETEYFSPVPLVKVSAEGKIIVDPESINVCPFDKKLKEMKKRKIIKEDEYSSRVKIMNHIRKQKKDTISSLFTSEESEKRYSKFWTLEETLKFYKVLNEFGSDFSVMQEAFPYRTRKQLKRKFHSEEKVRMKYVDLAMTKRDSIDFKALEKELIMIKKRPEKRDDKDKVKLLTPEKEKKFEKLMQVEFLPLGKRRKLTLSSEINFDLGVHRLGRSYDEKEKNFRRFITRMKSRYLEEKCKENKTFKNFRKCRGKKNDTNSKKKLKKNCAKLKYKEGSDTESDVETCMFDVGNPSLSNNLYLEHKKIFQKFVDDSFIKNMKDEDDLNLFLSISSKMYRNLGADWRTWIRNTIIDKLLKKEEDCGAKRAAIKLKTDLEEKEHAVKLERSYQLFADPYDYTDPFMNYGNDL